MTFPPQNFPLLTNFLLRRGDFRLLRLLNRQEKLKLGRQFVFRVEAVREVDTADPTVCVDLHSEGFDVVGSVSAAGEVREVELNLVPSLLQVQKVQWRVQGNLKENSRQVSSASYK
jgi:hypothetical protein